MGNANSSTKIAEKLDVRKCVFSCGGEMRLVKMIKGGMFWSCIKCGKHISKIGGDYTRAQQMAEYSKKE